MRPPPRNPAACRGDPRGYPDRLPGRAGAVALLTGALLLSLAACATDAPDVVPAPDLTVPNLLEVRAVGSAEAAYWIWSAPGASPGGQICLPPGADWPAVEPVDYVSIGAAPPAGGWCEFLRSRGRERAIVMDWEGAFPPTAGRNVRPACE